MSSLPDCCTFAGGGIRISIRKLAKGSLSLKDEIKALMFPLTGPRCVSDDSGLFQVVMTAFYQHEQTVSEVNVSVCVSVSACQPASMHVYSMCKVHMFVVCKVCVCLYGLCVSA